VTEQPGTSGPMLFADRRQARGWLVSQWCIYAIAVVIWARLLLQLTVTGGDLVPPLLVVVVILGLAAVLGWSWWVSRGIRAHLVEAVRRQDLRWWQRDRFVTEQAAARLDWPPTLTLAVGRGLILLAGVLTVASLAIGLTPR
jgi:hypothetical protein